MNFTAPNAGDDLAMLVFEDALHLLIGVLRRFQEILVGSLKRMDDRAADINGGFDSPLFPRLRLDVIDDVIVLDVGIEASHHQDMPRCTLRSVTTSPRMLTTSPSPGKKKLDTFLSGFV